MKLWGKTQQESQTDHDKPTSDQGEWGLRVFMDREGNMRCRGCDSLWVDGEHPFWCRMHDDVMRRGW